MRGLSDEEILAVWESVTDFTEGWHEAIAELISRLDDLKLEMGDMDLRGNLDDLRKRLVKLRLDIEETAEAARNGEISLEDLENNFRDYGETLSSLEAEVLELELEPEDKYYDEEFEDEI
jgi:uncharacterized coiled-coil DUF342 family protein